MRWAKDNLEKAIEESSSIAEVLCKLDLVKASSNYKTFHKYVALYKLEISCLKRHKKLPTPRIPTEDILVENSSYTNTGHLKTRLLRENTLENKCQECGLLGHWNGKTLILQLDHINGVANDNRIENLRILCPNCHTQTETYAGKRTKTRCCDCGTSVTSKSVRCASCAGKHVQQTKIDWPSIPTLLQMISETNVSTVSRKLGVSGNAIRKRIRKHS